MRMHARRALSPLVATILLIAFAVALGSVVFTYLSVSMTGGMESAGCANYARLGSPDMARDGAFVFSYDGSSVAFTLLNDGEVKVVREVVNIVGSRDVFSTDVTRTLSPGRVARITLPYDEAVYGTPQKVVVIPVFIKAGQDTHCPEGKIIFTKREE